MQEIYEEEHTEVLARIVWARTRPSMLWLGGAALSFLAAVAIAVAAPRPTYTVERTTMLGLEHEAAELGRTVDAAALAAHRRADGVADTPMMRAAVLTDAATVADIMKSEVKLALAPGEIIELLQIHGAALETLIRLPAKAAALPHVPDRDATLVDLDGTGLRVVVGAHVDRLKDAPGYDASKAGMFVLSAPVDLEAIRRRLARYAGDAMLTGSGEPVHLVHRAGAAGRLVPLAVPSSTEKLTLSVAPLATGHRAAWIAPARNASLVLGTLMLIAFAAILALRQPRPRRYADAYAYDGRDTSWRRGRRA